MEIQPVQKNVPTTQKQSASKGDDAQRKEFSSLIGDILKSLKMQGPELDLTAMMGSPMLAPVRQSKGSEKTAASSNSNAKSAATTKDSSLSSDIEVESDESEVTEKTDAKKKSCDKTDQEQSDDKDSKTSGDDKEISKEPNVLVVEAEAANVAQAQVQAKNSESNASAQSDVEASEVPGDAESVAAATDSTEQAPADSQQLAAQTTGQEIVNGQSTSQASQDSDQSADAQLEPLDSAVQAEAPQTARIDITGQTDDASQAAQQLKTALESNRNPSGDTAENSAPLASFMASLAAKAAASAQAETATGAQDGKLAVGAEIGISSTNSLFSKSAFSTLSGLLGDSRKTGQTSGNGEKTPSANLVRNSGTKLLEKIEQVLKEAAQSRDGKTIAVRLDPPELGQLMIGISFRDGALHARVSAEQSSVNDLLRERAADIHQILRRLGLNVDKVSVAVGTEAFFASSQGDTKQGETQQGNTSRREGSLPGERGGTSSFDSGDSTDSESTNEPVGDDHWVA